MKTLESCSFLEVSTALSVDHCPGKKESKGDRGVPRKRSGIDVIQVEPLKSRVDFAKAGVCASLCVTDFQWLLPESGRDLFC